MPPFGALPDQDGLDKAAAQAGTGDSVAAHRTYRTFARDHKTDALAPENLVEEAMKVAESMASQPPMALRVSKRVRDSLKAAPPFGASWANAAGPLTDTTSTLAMPSTTTTSTTRLSSGRCCCRRLRTILCPVTAGHGPC